MKLEEVGRVVAGAAVFPEGERGERRCEFAAERGGERDPGEETGVVETRGGAGGDRRRVRAGGHGEFGVF